MEAQQEQVNLSCTYSHQPYLIAIHGKPQLFYCYAFNSIQALYGDSVYSYTPWKLGYSEWGNPVVNRLNTGFASDEIECSPVLTVIDNQLLLTFVGGAKDDEGTIRYHLYAMQGSDLSSLSSPQKLNQEFTFCGFQNKEYQIRNWREPETEILDLVSGRLTTVYFNDFDTIQRIVPVPEIEDLILVTGSQTGVNRTFLYEVGTNSPIKEILIDNKPVYKSCVWRNKLVYAKQTGEDFEQRQLFFSLMTCPQGKCQDTNCDRKPFCLVEMRLQTSRNTNASKAIASQESEDNKREFTGIYLGFDTKSGQDLIQLPSGGVIRASSLSNGIAKPQYPISGVMPLGSIMAFVDRMPR